MGAIGYLYRRTLYNRVRMALRKPVTYLYLAILLFYFLAVPSSLKVMTEGSGMDSPRDFAGVLTVLSFWLLPANLIAYAKRRGLVYRKSDVHFLFPAPVSPKQVLLYAHVKTLLVQVLLNLFAVVCGGKVFHVEGWRLGIYFVFSILIENLLEGGIMLLLYGSERLGEKQRGMVTAAAYALAGILVLMGIGAYLRGGLSLGTVSDFLHSDGIQMVPFVGWYIAVVHLLFTGATAVNVAGTVCYLLLLAAVLTAAVRMKCTGAYYEDAMKFAEDYEEVLESRRQGSVRRLGKKQKFTKASIRWRGKGARALFYRQLLEYKKNRFFIFDISTAVALLAGAGIAYVYVHGGGFGTIESFRVFVIPAVSSYVIFIFTGFNGKWAKELKSPYTYLIPDTPFRKLVNATMMQHIQNCVNSCLIVIPGAVAMGIGPVEALLCMLFYVAFSANKLYALAVVEVMAGSTLGVTGKQLLQMLFQSIAIFAAVLGAFGGVMAGGIWLGMVFMDVFLVLFTVIFMVIAMLNFYSMEAVS